MTNWGWDDLITRQGEPSCYLPNPISPPASLEIFSVCVQSACLLQTIRNTNQSILRFAHLLSAYWEGKHLYSNKILSGDSWGEWGGRQTERRSTLILTVWISETDSCLYKVHIWYKMTWSGRFHTEAELLSDTVARGKTETRIKLEVTEVTILSSHHNDAPCF